jgi:hypothetical protein
MILKKYSDFLNTKMVNENLDRSKKFLKERALLKKAANELGFIDDDLSWKIKEGEKKTIVLGDFTPEQQGELRNKLRSMKLSDKEIKDIESDPEFIKIKELLQSNIGYLYNFIYMYYVEMVPFDGPGGIEDLYKRIIENKAVLDKLPKKFDANFIDTTLPNKEERRNNAEILEDGLDSLKDYKLVQKILETLPKKLKQEYNSAPELTKQQFSNIAKGFDEVPDDKKEKVWKTFFGELRLDTRATKIDGSPNPNFNKMVYMSSLVRFVNMENPLREFIKAAQNHLESSTNEGYADRIDKINQTNDKFGNLGATIVYDNKGILVIEVKSFQANKLLNGHTSHCIKDSTYQWDSYVGNRNNKQYYIYNFNLSPFDNNSTIGITIGPGQSIYAAHDKPDRSVASSIKDKLKKWEEEYEIEDDIWSYLKPVSQEEIERKERAKLAEREIVKKGLSIEQIKKYVTEDGADINKDNAKALVNAVEEDDIDKIKYCLELGASPNLTKGNDSAIARAKSLDVIKLLVTYGSDMTGSVYKNILNDVEALDFCLKAGLDPDFDRSMPLRGCCKGSWRSRNEPGESYFESLKILLKHGAKIVNELNRNTVLKWACEYNRMEILEYLKENNYLDNLSPVRCSQTQRNISQYEDAVRWMSHARRMSDDDKDKMIKYLEKEHNEWESKMPKGWREK